MDRPATAPALHANLILVGALLLGLVLAVFMGMVIGNSEVKPLLLISLATAGIVFAVSLYRYVWHFALFLLFLGFGFRPTSFTFGALELACALGFAVAGLFIWQRKTVKRPPVVDTPAFRFVNAALFVLLLYIALHFFVNTRMPHRPGEFALNNAVKSYFALAAPFVLLFYFLRNPSGLVVRGNFFLTICRLALVGVLINVAIRLFELAGGGVYIPLLNGMPGLYTLRALAPLALLLGVVGLTDRKRGGRILLFVMLMTVGTIGAVFSGGRATLVLGFVMICTVFIIRRKVLALSAVAIIGVIGFAVANLFADWINTRANPFVQRSLQWILIQKNWETVHGIENSTEWRTELARRAYREWLSEPRIFWTGRATYGYGAADERAILISGGYEAIMQIGLRRGATHNLLTDLLVAYGLIGCIIYLALWGGLIVLAWTLYRHPGLRPPAANLALVCFVGSLYALIYSLLAGNMFPAEIVWFFIVLIGSFFSGAGYAPPAPRIRHSEERAPVRTRNRFAPSTRPLLPAGRR